MNMALSFAALAAIVGLVCVSNVAAVRNGNVPPSEMTSCHTERLAACERILQATGTVCAQ